MELLIILSAGKGMTDCWKELKRLGVKIYDRTEATVLLTTVENGKKRGIGAIGMNVHTGKLLVFRAKATMLTMSRPARVWLFNPDLVGLCENPHDLMRTHEVLDILDVAEMILHACLMRKSSSKQLCFTRSDYTEMDPQKDRCFITLRKERDQVVEGEVPLDYFGALRLNMSYLWNNRYTSMQNICTAIGNAFSLKSKSGLCPGAAV